MLEDIDTARSSFSYRLAGSAVTAPVSAADLPLVDTVFLQVDRPHVGRAGERRCHVQRFGLRWPMTVATKHPDHERGRGERGSIVLFVLFVCLAVAVLVQTLSVVVVCADRALGSEESGRLLMDGDRRSPSRSTAASAVRVEAAALGRSSTGDARRSRGNVSRLADSAGLGPPCLRPARTRSFPDVVSGWSSEAVTASISRSPGSLQEACTRAFRVASHPSAEPDGDEGRAAAPGRGRPRSRRCSAPACDLGMFPLAAGRTAGGLLRRVERRA